MYIRMPRRKAINMETQYHPAYWRRVKNELEAYNTKAGLVSFRKKLLEDQQKNAYSMEYDKIRGLLSNSSLPFQTQAGLMNRRDELQKLGAKALSIS